MPKDSFKMKCPKCGVDHEKEANQRCLPDRFDWCEDCDKQIEEAIETEKKTVREHDQRLRQTLSRVVSGFDSANHYDWIRLAVRLTSRLGPPWTRWREMPIAELLVVVDEVVDEAVHEREKQFKTVFKSKPLFELFFTVRTINCFDRAGLETIGDLIQKSPEDLLLLPHFGKKSLAEVREQLDRYELKLRGDK